MTENEKYLYNHFLISIKSGFESLEDIISTALETVDEEGWQSEISEEWVRETLAREYEKNEQRCKSSRIGTDTEKLVEVFDKLCKDHILALHNVGYTDSEAVYDTLDVWEDLEDENIRPIGYCYYNGQGLERVIREGELPIGFSGRKENNVKEAILIGNRVKEALENAGFDVKWSHSATDKISIMNFTWINSFSSGDEVEKKWGHDRVFRLMKG